MPQVTLNREDYTYLCHATFLHDELKKILLSATRSSDHYLINLSDDASEEIRDLCGEQLQLAGFNEKYELTSEGQTLERLIDKFFVG